jgi:hypothetical protein
MTDTPNMRERLARAIFPWVGLEGMTCPHRVKWDDPDLSTAPRDDERALAYAAVDALLAELERPSEAVINTVLDESCKVFGADYNAYGPLEWHFRAMVKAIRGGA